MKKHKGQVIVEFALVLPLFLLLLFGIVYSGLLFYDYSSLSNIARTSAREAAIMGGTYNNGYRYNTIESYYKDGDNAPLNTLITSLYEKDSDPIKIVHIKESGQPDAVRVTINMHLVTSSYLMRMVLPNDYSIVYYMRKEQSS